MIVMVFVNDLASVKGLPWWNYHAPAKVDAMTYVDMVFPAFLFILGMAIPLATEQRLRKIPHRRTFGSISSPRSLSLLMLGLILANAGAGDLALIHMPPYLWAILALLGAMLFWMVYPRSETPSDPRQDPPILWTRPHGLRCSPSFAARQKTAAGHGSARRIPRSSGSSPSPISPPASSISPLGAGAWSPFVWLVPSPPSALCALPIGSSFPTTPGSTSGPSATAPTPSSPWPESRRPHSSSAHKVTAGPPFVLKPPQPLAFAAITLVAARLLTPLGISKIRATPTWCLYSIGSSILIFLLLYWICDVHRHTRWAVFTRAPGSNTLLTYLLPDLWYFILGVLGITWFRTHLAWGFPGVVRSIVFTAFIVAIATLLKHA